MTNEYDCKIYNDFVNSLIRTLKRSSIYLTSTPYDDNFRSKVTEAFEKYKECISSNKDGRTNCVEKTIEYIYINEISNFCRKLTLNQNGFDCNIKNLEIRKLEELLNAIKEVEEKRSLLVDLNRSLCVLFCKNIIDNEIDLPNNLSIHDLKMNNRLKRRIVEIIRNTNDDRIKGLAEVIKICIEDKIEKMLGCYLDKLEVCVIPDITCTGPSLVVRVYPCVFVSHTYATKVEPNIRVENNSVLLNNYKIIEWEYQKS